MKQVKKNIKPMVPTESEIRKQICDHLRWTGFFVYYNLAGMGSYPGLSDLVAVRDGRVVHIEIKKPGGVQSDKQKRFQQKIEAAGGTYILAYGVEDVEEMSGKKQLQIPETIKK